VLVVELDNHPVVSVVLSKLESAIAIHVELNRRHIPNRREKLC
jgi:hypothetical protein